MSKTKKNIKIKNKKGGTPPITTTKKEKPYLIHTGYQVIKPDSYLSKLIPPRRLPPIQPIQTQELSNKETPIQELSIQELSNKESPIQKQSIQKKSINPITEMEKQLNKISNNDLTIKYIDPYPYTKHEKYAYKDTEYSDIPEIPVNSKNELLPTIIEEKISSSPHNKEEKTNSLDKKVSSKLKEKEPKEPKKPKNNLKKPKNYLKEPKIAPEQQQSPQVTKKYPYKHSLGALTVPVLGVNKQYFNTTKNLSNVLYSIKPKYKRLSRYFLIGGTKKHKTKKNNKTKKA